MSGLVQFSANKYLEEIGEFGITTDNSFYEDNLKEMRNSSGTFFSDMCRIFGVEGAKKRPESWYTEQTLCLQNSDG